MKTPEALVQSVNHLPYPPTIYAHNWIYGVWYCGTSFQKAIYYGQFPATFVKRIQAMFTGLSLLHLCCGRCHISGAVNVDNQALPEVDIIADVEELPFKPSSFGAILIDPPYSDEDASRYKQRRLIKSARVLKEAARVLEPHGWLAWLDEKYPAYRRGEWNLRGLIGIVTGFERRTRILSLFQNAKA